jgi:hypothetical protein
MPRFHVTFDIVTPESAARGDAARMGFVSATGGHQKRPIDLSLREAVRLMGCTEDSGSWFTETDGRRNHSTGAEERRALHPPRTISPGSYARLKRLLRAL